MPPRNLQYNDAILDFEAASEKYPTEQELVDFLDWLTSNRKDAKRWKRLVKQIIWFKEVIGLRRTVPPGFLVRLEQEHPYRYYELYTGIAWLREKTEQHGTVNPEAILWLV